MQAKIRVRLHREGSGTHDVAKMKKHPEEAMTETRAEKNSVDRKAFTERTSTPKEDQGRHAARPRKVLKEDKETQKSAQGK